ncbi:MAG: invasin domain 3-containing protein [bacterium]|jgi:hypothetical protein
MIEDKRKVLAAVVALAACLLLMCSEKDGSLSPDLETDPPQYLIEYVTPSPAKVEPNGLGTVSARVVDRDYAPVQGKTVEFEASGGSVDAEVTTGSDGIATADYTAPSTPGYMEISARTSGAVSKSTMVQVGEGALEFGSAALYADGISWGTLTLTLTDEDDEPIEGAAVSFSIDHGYIADADNKTDAFGQAEAKIVSAVSETDLAATVEAQISYGGNTYSEIAMISMLGVTLDVDADPKENPADGISASAVSASLKLTSSGTPLAGFEVFFGTNLGAIGASAYTNTGGTATSVLISPTTSGTADVVARYGGHEDTVQVTFGELDLRLTPSLTRMVADGVTYQAVYATLLTEDNNPVVGATINFSTTSGVITRSSMTNMWGDAVAFLTSSASPATATVTATFENVSDDAQVSFENPVIILTATPLSVVADPSMFTTISAYVSFSDGMPVPDSTFVAFQTTEGTIAPYEFTQSGIVYTNLVPSGVASDDVTVTAYSGSTMETTDVIFMPGVPTFVHVTATPTAIPGDGNAYATVMAEITDAYGNHVKDGTGVNFSLVSGSGIMPPSAVTSSGTATVKFLPVQGPYTATIMAETNAYFDLTSLSITGGSPGAIVAMADTSWIQVAGAYESSQANVIAAVYDGSMNPVEDGTEVTFEITQAPGGGEFIDLETYGYGPVTKSTIAGAVSAVVNSGTKPGTVVLEISSGDALATAVPIGISSGDPDSIMVSVGDVVRNSDGTYTYAVSAIVRDRFMNPVENGTPVYFTLDRTDVGIIDPETPTGGIYPCLQHIALPTKGVARACLHYQTYGIFEVVTITASSMGGEIEGEFTRGLPIVSPTLSIEASPATLTGATGGSSLIQVWVWDSFMLPVNNAWLTFSVDGDGEVFPTEASTAEGGFPAMTTLTVDPGAEAGTITVKAHLWTTDVQAEVSITIIE